MVKCASICGQKLGRDLVVSSYQLRNLQRHYHKHAFKHRKILLPPLVPPDPREEEEHGHVPHVHADGEPEGHQVPAGDGGRQHFYIPPSDRTFVICSGL